ncbi:MAG: secretin and TonB N-terminal domain-containing protein [Candidatus Omnitrophica bacterium]|nr:secretin and TonB N-terminal domain-containing protein [Candidatus Omnitrophota bacterium]
MKNVIHYCGKVGTALFAALCIISWCTLPVSFAQQSEERLISMDFRDTEIGDILRLMAKQNDLNIIISEEVAGPVSVQFSNVTVDEALDAIVTVNGFAYTRKGRIIKVTTPEEAEREPPITQIFQLKNADVTMLKEALAKVLSESGTIEADTRSNSLIVTDTPAVINTIEKLVVQLDAETPQVRIEARVVETTLEDTENLGIDWTNQVTLSGAKRPVTFPFDRKALGGSFYPLGDQAATGPGFPPNGGASFPEVTSDVTGTTALFTFGTLDFTAYRAVLQVLYSRENTTTLANPTIITLDNQEAKISVARAEPIPGSFERNETTGNFEITSIEEKEIGVVLTVTPHVNREGTITLDLMPEVSSLLTTKTIESIQYPVTSVRRAETKVQIADGETVVIGGLINQTDTDDEKKIPILGEIPILGHLFKKTEKGKTKTDLIIFITAHILDTDTHRAFTEKAILATEIPEEFPQFEAIQKRDEAKKKPKPLIMDLRPVRRLELGAAH